MELKAFNCVESDLQEFCEPCLVYLKSDVDRMIAELKDKCQMHETEDACMFLTKSEWHQKYKRCLAMARWCESEDKRIEALAPLFDIDKECWEFVSGYWNKWHKRWLELAESFK